jgi:hypothetical protein
VWGSDGGWKEIDRIHRRICKKILVFSTFSANIVVEVELERGSRRGKVLCICVK